MIPTGRIYSSISCAEEGNILWTDRFPSQINVLSTNAFMTAAAMTDGSLYILQSKCGRRLLPCIELGCELAILECSPKSSPFLLAICTDGQIRVWNVYTQQALLTDRIDAVLTGPVSIDEAGDSHATVNSIVRSRVSSAGQPFITISIVDKVCH